MDLRVFAQLGVELAHVLLRRILIQLTEMTKKRAANIGRALQGRRSITPGSHRVATGVRHRHLIRLKTIMKLSRLSMIIGLLVKKCGYSGLSLPAWVNG